MCIINMCYRLRLWFVLVLLLFQYALHAQDVRPEARLTARAQTPLLNVYGTLRARRDDYSEPAIYGAGGATVPSFAFGDLPNRAVLTGVHLRVVFVAQGAQAIGITAVRADLGTVMGQSTATSAAIPYNSFTRTHTLEVGGSGEFFGVPGGQQALQASHKGKHCTTRPPRVALTFAHNARTIAELSLAITMSGRYWIVFDCIEASLIYYIEPEVVNLPPVMVQTMSTQQETKALTTTSGPASFSSSASASVASMPSTSIRGEIEPQAEDASGENKSNVLPIVFSVLGIVFFLIACGVVALLLAKRRKRQSQASDDAVTKMTRPVSQAFDDGALESVRAAGAVRTPHGSDAPSRRRTHMYASMPASDGPEFASARMEVPSVRRGYNDVPRSGNTVVLSQRPIDSADSNDDEVDVRAYTTEDFDSSFTAVASSQPIEYTSFQH